MEDFNSKYTGQQVEDLLDQVASGNADVYIADFTMESLRDGMYNGHQVTCDMQALVAAMNANKIILVRKGEDSYYKGVYVLNGYTEDYLYFSIVDTAGDILWCDGTDYISSSYIDGRSLRLRDWDNNQDKLISGENIKTFNGESLLGEGDITTPTFLRIGDTDDEAKANFIAVANREKSADYYICSSRVQNTPIHGIVTKLGEAGPTNSPVYVRYDIYGSTTSGELGGKLLKITTELTTATGEITTTYESILDAKQDTITDLATIREGAAKGAVAYEKPSTGIPKSDLAASVQSALVDAETFKGKYTKPDAGIPKGDLESSVQTSLSKADTALQPKDKRVYIIPDFTLEDLKDVLSNGGNTIDCQSQNIYTKAEDNVICIRVSDTTNYSGVIPAISSTKDDLLYLLFYDNYNNKLYQVDVIEEGGANVSVKPLNLWDVSDLLSSVRADGEAGIALTKGFIYDEHASVYYALPKSANGDEDDVLLTRETIKTINGESLLGNGDITIEGGSGTITEIKANGTSVATSGVANIPAASTSVYGVTKLSSATNSTSTTLAATASAVKAAYDLANSYKGTVTGVKINGTTKSPSSGTVDIGNVVTSIKINGSTKTPSSGVVDLGTISGGGSSSGSGAYSEVNHGTGDTTFTLTPNTFHIWDEVANLTLTLGSETSGVANEFLFQFNSGATATSLTLTDDIKWVNDTPPTIESNMIYQVSILKGLASVLEFSNAPTLIENKVTVSISGTKYLVSLQYAAASDLVVKVRTVDGAVKVNIASGQISGSGSIMSPMMDSNAFIESVVPEIDSTYIYIK